MTTITPTRVVVLSSGGCGFETSPDPEDVLPRLQHSADRRMSSAASPPPAGRPAGPPAEAANYLGPISATPHYVVSAMLHLAKANANTVVFDLGCSDGRVPIAAARDHGVKSAVGYEISEVAYARSIAALASCDEDVRKHVTLIHGDAFEADLRQADVVFLYLLPRGLRKLEEKLNRELKPGTRIVTYLFQLPPSLGKWAAQPRQVVGVTNPAKKNVVDTSDVSKLYLYEVDGGHAQAKRRSALLVMMAALAAAAVFRLR